MPIDIKGAVDRIVAIEKEGLAALSPSVTCDAVNRFFHVQEGFPYWINRVGTITLDSGIGGAEDYGEELDVYTVDITARLIVAHLTSGYKGENDALLQQYIPHMIEYINEREGLQHNAAPVALLNLIRARVTGAIGTAAFATSAGGAVQIGGEITIRLEFVYENALAYS